MSDELNRLLQVAGKLVRREGCPDITLLDFPKRTPLWLVRQIDGQNETCSEQMRLLAIELRDIYDELKKRGI